jgi:hypothetical protein
MPLQRRPGARQAPGKRSSARPVIEPASAPRSASGPLARLASAHCRAARPAAGRPALSPPGDRQARQSNAGSVSASPTARLEPVRSLASGRHAASRSFALGPSVAGLQRPAHGRHASSGLARAQAGVVHPQPSVKPVRDTPTTALRPAGRSSSLRRQAGRAPSWRVVREPRPRPIAVRLNSAVRPRPSSAMPGRWRVGDRI